MNDCDKFRISKMFKSQISDDYQNFKVWEMGILSQLIPNINCLVSAHILTTELLTA